MSGTGPQHPPLPRGLAEIAEIVGREAALDLAQHMGGRSIHVPRPENIRSTHDLAVAMGMEAAKAVAERFQGENRNVPMAKRALVFRLAAKGLTARQIADRLGITVHSARRYRRGSPGTMVP